MSHSRVQPTLLTDRVSITFSVGRWAFSCARTRPTPKERQLTCQRGVRCRVRLVGQLHVVNTAHMHQPLTPTNFTHEQEAYQWCMRQLSRMAHAQVHTRQPSVQTHVYTQTAAHYDLSHTPRQTNTPKANASFHGNVSDNALKLTQHPQDQAKRCWCSPAVHIQSNRAPEGRKIGKGGGEEGLWKWGRGGGRAKQRGLRCHLYAAAAH